MNCCVVILFIILHSMSPTVTSRITAFPPLPGDADAVVGGGAGAPAASLVLVDFVA